MIVGTKIVRYKIEIEKFIIFIGKIMNKKLFVSYGELQRNRGGSSSLLTQRSQSINHDLFFQYLIFQLLDFRCLHPVPMIRKKERMNG